MVEAMPPEDIAPLAPFPEIPPPAAEVPPAPGGEPSLLSEAQRLEFAFAAGSLDGVAFTALPPAEETAREDDFLLTPGTPPAAVEHLAAAPVEPAPRVDDFLAVPDVKEAAPAPDGEDAFDLQRLAAALTGEKPVEQAPVPETPEDWDLPPMDLSGPLPAPEPVRLENPPVVTAEPPVEETVSPIALIAAAALALPSSKTEPVKVPEPAVPDKPVEPVKPVVAEKPDTFPQFPPPRAPEPAVVPAPEPAQPVAEEPEDLEPEPDFDAPLLFPVPSVDGQTAALEPGPPANNPDRGVGLVLGGALLILGGIFLACRVPALAMDADAASVSSHALATARAAHLQGEMLVSAAGAAGLMVLGIGSATLRRWAPPLIHAAGWVVLLTTLIGMAAATAAMFHLSANETAGDAVPGDGTSLFAMAGILGIALPLGFIAIFQRAGAARLCAAVDAKARWTDRRSVPALMVFLTGFALAVICFALGLAKVLAPLFGDAAAADVSVQVWTGTGAAFGIAALLSAAGKRAGWWLLLLLCLALGTSLYLTCVRHDWHTLIQLPGAGAGSVAGGVLAAAGLLPAVLILLMTRRAFSHGGEHQ